MHIDIRAHARLVACVRMQNGRFSHSRVRCVRCAAGPLRQTDIQVAFAAARACHLRLRFFAGAGGISLAAPRASAPPPVPTVTCPDTNRNVSIRILETRCTHTATGEGDTAPSAPPATAAARFFRNFSVTWVTKNAYSFAQRRAHTAWKKYNYAYAFARRRAHTDM